MRRAALLSLLAALAVAGCGGGSGSTGEASKSAEQIARDAQQAGRAAKAAHVFGSINQQGGGKLSVDVHLVKNVGAKGRMGLKKGTVQLIRVGDKVYMNGNTAFWTSIGGDMAAQILHDRWIRVPPSQQGLAAIIRFTDLDQLVTGSVGAHGSLSKKGTTTYRGQKAIALEDSGGSGGTLYLAATGKPYPLAIVSPNNGAEGAIDFDQWNKVVAISAPKGAVDLSKLAGGG